jgi:hypothetical protein
MSQPNNHAFVGMHFFLDNTYYFLSIIKHDMHAIDVGITSSFFYVFLEILEIFVGNSMIS